jgi:hypothetical protein
MAVSPVLPHTSAVKSPASQQEQDGQQAANDKRGLLCLDGQQAANDKRGLLCLDTLRARRPTCATLTPDSKNKTGNKLQTTSAGCSALTFSALTFFALAALAALRARQGNLALADLALTLAACCWRLMATATVGW